MPSDFSLNGNFAAQFTKPTLVFIIFTFLPHKDQISEKNNFLYKIVFTSRIKRIIGRYINVMFVNYGLTHV